MIFFKEIDYGNENHISDGPISDISNDIYSTDYATPPPSTYSAGSWSTTQPKFGYPPVGPNLAYSTDEEVNYEPKITDYTPKSQQPAYSRIYEPSSEQRNFYDESNYNAPLKGSSYNEEYFGQRTQGTSIWVIFTLLIMKNNNISYAFYINCF